MQPAGLEFVFKAMLFTLPGGLLMVMIMFSFVGPRRLDGLADPSGEKVSEELSCSPFMVDVFGRFTPDQVTQTWHDQARRTTERIEAIIEKTWNEKLADARQKNQPLYNGELARLLRCTVKQGKLHLDLGQTCYRDFLGTNLYNTQSVLEFGADCLSNALGISTTVLTRDGFVCYGRRNNRVAFHQGYLHTFGGALESADRMPGGEYDVFSAAMRELCEELMLQPNEIKQIVCTGMVRDRELLQPELLFDAMITLTRNEVLGRFDPDADGQEHSAIECCWDIPEEVRTFLGRSAPIAPVCEGALMLHGRHSWGQDWYETSCLLRYGETPPQVG